MPLRRISSSIVLAARVGAATCRRAPQKRPKELRATARTMTSRGVLATGHTPFAAILAAQRDLVDLAIRRAGQGVDHVPALGRLDAKQGLAVAVAEFFRERCAARCGDKGDRNLTQPLVGHAEDGGFESA